MVHTAIDNYLLNLFSYWTTSYLPSENRNRKEYLQSGYPLNHYKETVGRIGRGNTDYECQSFR